jgi:hypothetical protein
MKTRHRRRWYNNIKVNIKEMNRSLGWIYVALWNTVMNTGIPCKVKNLFTG